MKDIGKIGLIIGIIAGIGLGLMIGSEFSGRYITLIGAALVVISIIAIICALLPYMHAMTMNPVLEEESDVA